MLQLICFERQIRDQVWADTVKSILSPDYKPPQEGVNLCSMCKLIAYLKIRKFNFIEIWFRVSEFKSTGSYNYGIVNHFGIFTFLFLIRLRRASYIYLQKHDALETTLWSPSEKMKAVPSSQNWARR